MIYLMRHGLDDERYIGGHSDVSLVKEGVKQVIEAREFVDNNLFINKIISSDIKRAVQTSEIMNSHRLGTIEYNSKLRELDKGDLTGLEKSIVLEKYPQFVRLSDINESYPNGESLVSFYKRIKESLSEILSQDNSLVITHRGVINMIYFILKDIHINYNKEMFGVSHASIHECDFERKLIRKIY